MLRSYLLNERASPHVEELLPDESKVVDDYVRRLLEEHRVPPRLEAGLRGHHRPTVWALELAHFDRALVSPDPVFNLGHSVR